MESGPADGDPLVLLHGVGANAMYWRYQFAGFGDRWRVIAWNAPGYFLTDALRDDCPDGQGYADALANFLDSVGVRRADILANSFGTRVAQYFALHHPARVRRMVLTGVGIGRKGLSEQERASALAARETQVAAGAYAFGDRVSALLGPLASEETTDLVRHVLRATNPRGFLQAARFGLRPVSSLDFVERLTMPILLIQGDQDRVNPLADNAQPLANALPNGRLEVLPDIGHLPEVEAPDVVNALTREFLSA